MIYSGNLQADLQDSWRNSEPSSIACPTCGWNYPAEDITEAFCKETGIYSDKDMCLECTADWIKEQLTEE